MGKRRERTIITIIMFFAVFLNAQAQDKVVEEKALEYFCKNVMQINKHIVDFDIKFSGKTQPKPCNIYILAHCIGEINLLKDSIPIKNYLDSIYKINCKSKLKVKKLYSHCSFFKKRSFAKRACTLYVFESIEYKGYFYVELYLFNKRGNSCIFCVKFDKDNKNVIGHYIKYITYD
jgi:hypothetical protein